MSRKVFIGPKEKAKINTGGFSAGTTAAQLSTNDRELKGGVQLVADNGNTNIVYVGVRENITAGTDNALDGFPLTAGQAIFLPVTTESEVWIIAAAASQGIHFASF